MPNAFDFSASPFDCLDAIEQDLVERSVDIVYVPEGQTLLAPGTEPTHLFVVIKGQVAQYDQDAPVASYGAADCFDGRALMAGAASSRFVAAEEVVAYQVPKATIKTLISRNATFGALLFSDLSEKLGTLAQRHALREVQAVTLAQVSQAYLRPAHEVSGDCSIVEAARVMHEHLTSSVLVRDGARLGIFTNTGLQRAVVGGASLAQMKVRDQATFDLVRVSPHALLFEALTLMIRHQIHRLVVTDGERVLGLLEQLDLLSFLSNHSYLITVQIVRAQDLATLKQEADKITRFIGLMYRGGTRVGQLGKLVQALNATLFERTWQLVAPAALVEGSCLFVMGSEGRGEQLLKTDQDNALVLRDDLAMEEGEIQAACERFSQALREFGYPDCAGGIMLSRSEWRHRATEFTAVVRRWLLQPTAEAMMALSIFIDAHAVAGDESLLARLRDEVERHISTDDALLGQFARAIDLFPDQSVGWWQRLLGDHGGQSLDLKKAGIFPIVHGVRSMALRERIRDTGTVERLQALVVAGRLPAQLAGDVTDALHFLMGLKLKAGLAELDAGQPVSGHVAAARLTSLERDLLKDALAVVKRFKTLVRHQFRLVEAG